MATTTVTINIESLFDRVNQRTLYTANHIDPEVNSSLIDKIALTRDEYDAFLVFMRQGAVEVFKAISRLSKGIEAPFTYTIPDGETVATDIVYKMEFNVNAQVDIVSPIMLDHIVRALVAYIVMEWLKLQGINTKLFLIDEADYNYCMKELRAMTGYGAKPKIKYRYF